MLSVWAFVEAGESQPVREALAGTHEGIIQDGLNWLQNSYDENLGWVPNPNRKKQQDIYLGLTAQTLFVLIRAARRLPNLSRERWLIQAKNKFLENDFTISLSSNRQVKSDDESFPGTGYTDEATSFLWYPWSVAVLRLLSTDTSLSSDKMSVAGGLLDKLYRRLPDLEEQLEAGGTYQPAENLFALSYAPR
jgi:hypothetical protein